MPIESEILKYENRLLLAMKNADLKELDILIHDDLLFNGPDGKTITKEMDLEAYKSGMMKVKEITSGDCQIKTYKDTAVVTVTVSITGEFMNQPILSQARFIRIWKNFEGQWKVIAGASSFLKTE